MGLRIPAVLFGQTWFQDTTTPQNAGLGASWYGESTTGQYSSYIDTAPSFHETQSEANSLVSADATEEYLFVITTHEVPLPPGHLLSFHGQCTQGRFEETGAPAVTDPDNN